MKNDILFILAGGAIALSSVSCSVEENKAAPENDGKVHMVFTSGIATRTALVDDKSVIWSDSDDITIFGGDNNPAPFILTNGAGEAQATFEGDAVEADTYYALYPHYGDASIAGETVSSVLPAEQTYTAGTFAAKLNPSVAKTTGNTLEFKNIAALLKVSVKNLADKTVSSVSVKADDAIAGAYSVDMSGDSYTAAASTEGAREVTLNAEGAAESDYYLVLLPGTHSGMVITVNYSDGSYSQKTASQAIDLSASEIFTLSVDASQAEMPEPTLYQQYMAGQDIEIAGKIYNKTQFGDAQLITADTEISKLEDYRGVYFIEPNATLIWNCETAAQTLLFIGNDSDVRSTINPKIEIRTNSSRADYGEILLYNVEGDLTTYNKFLFSQYNDDSKTVIRVIDSKFILSTLFINAAGVRGYNNIDVENSIFKLTNSSNFINMGTGTGTNQNIFLKNNIYYSENVLNNYKLYAGNSSSIGKVTLENNTFVNIHSKTNGIFTYSSLTEVELRNNLVYIETQESGICFFKPAIISGVEAGATYPGNPKQGTCEQSIFYSANQSTNNAQWFYSGMNRVELTTEKEFEKLTATPFANLSFETEDFTTTAEWSTYGARQ